MSAFMRFDEVSLAFRDQAILRAVEVIEDPSDDSRILDARNHLEGTAAAPTGLDVSATLPLTSSALLLPVLSTESVHNSVEINIIQPANRCSEKSF